VTFGETPMTTDPKDTASTGFGRRHQHGTVRRPGLRRTGRGRAVPARPPGGAVPGPPGVRCPPPHATRPGRLFLAAPRTSRAEMTMRPEIPGGARAGDTPLAGKTTDDVWMMASPTGQSTRGGIWVVSDGSPGHSCRWRAVIAA